MAAPTSSTPVLYVVRLKLSPDGRFMWINGYKCGGPVYPMFRGAASKGTYTYKSFGTATVTFDGNLRRDRQGGPRGPHHDDH